MRISTSGLLSASLSAILLGSVLLPHTTAAQTSFGSVNLGSSVTSTVTVTIPNGGTLSNISVVTQGAPNLDFTAVDGGTCAVGTSVSSCTVEVTFTPMYAGARNGAVVLSDGSGVIATAFLLGTGVGPQIAYPLNYPESPLGLPVPFSPTVSAASVAVDGSGNIYICCAPASGPAGQSSVVKETLSGGSYTQSTIYTGSMVSSGTLAVDGAGNVYINDSGNQNCTGCGPVNAAIYKETPSNGGYTETVVNTGLAESSVAVDGSGNIFWLDNFSVYAEFLQPDGSYMQSGPMTLPALAMGYNLDTIDSITVDGSGNLYIHIYWTDNLDVVGYPKIYDGLLEEVASSGTYTPIGVGCCANLLGEEVTYYPLVRIQADTRGVIYEWKNASEYLAIEVPQGNNNYYNSAYEGGDIYSLKYLAVDAGGNIYLANGGSLIKFDYSLPQTVSFQSTSEGVSSSDSPKSIPVVNIGNAPLTISSISFPADFPESTSPGTCAAGVTLEPAGSCYIGIDFTPIAALGSSASKVLTESVAITTNALPAMQTISLTGTEILLPVATPSFSIKGGSYNLVQSVTLSDSTTGATIYYTTDGKTTPTISSTPYTGAISVSSTETIQAIAVASGYSSSAVASATYTITPGFIITGTPVTVTAGAASGNTAAIALTPVGGFTGNVALTATITSGPSGGIQPTLSFGSTTPASITGAAAGTATLTITTTASSTTQCSSENRVRQGFPWYSGGGAVLACVLLFGVPARRRGWLKMLGVAVLLVALAGGAMACGGGGGGKACSTAVLAGTMPGSYTITVTGISNSITSTGTVTLTVQ
ncbi:MAG: chitobiase/beta-hexosaminidase C-terminal domain-containing protein [Terracidiphilus sp.]